MFLFLHFNLRFFWIQSHCVCVFYLLFKIYRVINIRILLAGLEIWTNGDPYTRVKDAGDLDRFKKYRNEILTKKIAHDNAHLLRLENV